jgi:hypothetical protein
MSEGPRMLVEDDDMSGADRADRERRGATSSGGPRGRLCGGELVNEMILLRWKLTPKVEGTFRAPAK